MREKKKALRAEVRAAGGAGMMLRTAGMYGNAAAESIEAMPEFAAARTVALYHAMSDEVTTTEMLRRWHGVKRLALPVVTEDGVMIFREYTGEEQLGIGAFGIREPKAGSVVPPEEIDLMVVPGMAFDAAGRRLGRGGGFYDRYLSQPGAEHIYKVGLCRSAAMVAEVPAEAHDVLMDIVIAN